MATVSRFTLGGLIEARLDGLTGISVYRGDVPNPLPVITTPDGPDPSGRVAKYIVLHTGGGDPVIDRKLSDTGDELTWSFQTNVGAGYDADCADAADQVVDRLHLWQPVQAGYQFGLVRPPFGFDPGNIRPQQIPGMPPRFFLPLQWRLQAHAI